MCYEPERLVRYLDWVYFTKLQIGDTTVTQLYVHIITSINNVTLALEWYVGYQTGGRETKQVTRWRNIVTSHISVSTRALLVHTFSDRSCIFLLFPVPKDHLDLDQSEVNRLKEELLIWLKQVTTESARYQGRYFHCCWYWDDIYVLWN